MPRAAGRRFKSHAPLTGRYYPLLRAYHRMRAVRVLVQLKLLVFTLVVCLLLSGGLYICLHLLLSVLVIYFHLVLTEYFVFPSVFFYNLYLQAKIFLNSIFWTNFRAKCNLTYHLMLLWFYTFSSSLLTINRWPINYSLLYYLLYLLCDNHF